MPPVASRRLPFATPCTPWLAAVACFENNPLVRKALDEPGRGRVLVVDAGASMRCAVLGDNLATNAQANGWSVRCAGVWGWGGGRGSSPGRA